jgi:hypothetical protein
MQDTNYFFFFAPVSFLRYNLELNPILLISLLLNLSANKIATNLG